MGGEQLTPLGRVDIPPDAQSKIDSDRSDQPGDTDVCQLDLIHVEKYDRDDVVESACNSRQARAHHDDHDCRACLATLPDTARHLHHQLRSSTLAFQRSFSVLSSGRHTVLSSRNHLHLDLHR